MPLWNQESMSSDQVLGPWDPGWGERVALEAEGRQNGGLGAEPPGIWGPYGPIWGPWLLSLLGPIGMLEILHTAISPCSFVQ